jgi:hypothetical protein
LPIWDLTQIAKAWLLRKQWIWPDIASSQLPNKRSDGQGYMQAGCGKRAAEQSVLRIALRVRLY